MNRLQAVTRRAAWTAFLPFAAVLLLVAPAEASVPRSAGVDQVDAVALASLERPALGLASPTLEPSGFSLGEDLSVFDTTKAQGSLGLCGLETRRCALTYARNNPVNVVDPTGMLGCTVNGKQTDCRVVVVYNKDKSKGTLFLIGATGKGRNKKEKTLLKGKVVVGSNGKTPTGKFTASYWEKDHVSTRYGWQANTPWSESPMGINAFGPYQLHIKEFESRGIWIHGTMGPRFGSSEFNRLVSPTSHGCVRCANQTIFGLRDLMPEPKGNQVLISTDPADAPDDDE